MGGVIPPKRTTQSPNYPLPERTVSAATAPVPPDADNPPDGGLLAWSQVIASLLMNMVVGGYPASFVVFQLYPVETMDLPQTQVPWIGSVQVFLAFAMCMVSGRLTDAGWAKETALLGSFFAVFGTFMTSLGRTGWHFFLAQGICTGIGLGLAFMPRATIVSTYFKRHRTFALALAATGSSCGSLMFPSIVQYLIPLIGFAWAVRCAAFVVLTICAIANSLLKPRLAPRKSGAVIKCDAFREPAYMFFALGRFLYLYMLYFAYFYVNSFARDIIGFSQTDSVTVLLVMNGIGIVARPLGGYLADRFFGPIHMFLSTLCAIGIALFAWIAVTTRTETYVFGALYGFVAGAGQGCYVGALTSLTKDPQKMGTRYGMVSTMTAFVVLAGPPTGGALIERMDGSYVGAQVWAGSVAVAAAVSVLGSRLATTGLKFKVKI